MAEEEVSRAKKNIEVLEDKVKGHMLELEAMGKEKTALNEELVKASNEKKKLQYVIENTRFETTDAVSASGPRDIPVPQPTSSSDSQHPCPSAADPCLYLPPPLQSPRNGYPYPYGFCRRTLKTPPARRSPQTPLTPRTWQRQSPRCKYPIHESKSSGHSGCLQPPLNPQISRIHPGQRMLPQRDGHPYPLLVDHFRPTTWLRPPMKDQPHPLS